jgi:transposase InsO family protein
MNLFYVGRIKGIGKIDQFTAVDCYSSFGFAGLAQTKSASNAIGFLETQVLPYFEGRALRRILTDNGTEFVCRGWLEEAHPFVDHLEASGIQHTTTKIRHPWTNGHVERFQQTVLKEFYQRVFQERHYESVSQLEGGLEDYLLHYNFERPHQGRHNDGRVPAELYMEPSRQPALVA